MHEVPTRNCSMCYSLGHIDGEPCPACNGRGRVVLADAGLEPGEEQPASSAATWRPDEPTA